MNFKFLSRRDFEFLTILSPKGWAMEEEKRRGGKEEGGRMVESEGLFLS